MARSPWLRVRPARLNALSDSVSLRLRGSDRLASPRRTTRRLILQKTRRNPRGPRHLGGAWFQVLFHSPRRGSFRLSLTVLSSIGGRTCSALDRGRPGFGQGSSCPALLRHRATGGLGLRLRGCHPLRPRCPARSAVLRRFCLPRVAPARPYNPASKAVWAPPSSLAATGGISVDFFSSRYLDGSLRAPGPAALFRSRARCAPRGARVAPFGNPGIVGRSRLPPDFRGLPRPSSPCGPKASAMRPLPLGHIGPSASPSLRQFPFPNLLSMNNFMETRGFEPLTLGLQSRCSSQLSYAPGPGDRRERTRGGPRRRTGARTLARHAPSRRKEVIQPHLPVRLPCYDFTPLAARAFDSGPLAVGLPASGPLHSDGVTGGVYKARERIHRAVLMRDY